MDFLHSIAFGPISINEIEKGLFLGSLGAAKSIDCLNKNNITHILTIDTCPLPRNILDSKQLQTMFIKLTDQPSEDLLCHFEDTFNFIDTGLAENGIVLVHCFFGVSRSATVVIAYLMKKYQITFQDAYQKVKAIRSVVHPNPGFVAQLKLYEEMSFKVDENNMKYKIFRLNLAASHVKSVKVLPQNFSKLIKPDPGLEQTKPESNVYKCKKCRRVLASESNLITHNDKETGDVCKKTYFVEPLAWMGANQHTQGKLNCPKCNAKLGSFNWTVGCQCPCGVQVSPAFYLSASKIDFSDVVKNVEVTF